MVPDWWVVGWVGMSMSNMPGMRSGRREVFTNCQDRHLSYRKRLSIMDIDIIIRVGVFGCSYMVE